MIISIFLLYILYLCSIRNRNLLRKVTRCYLPSTLEIWESTTLVVKSELSVFIQNILQFKTYRVKSRKKSCIRVNIRELDEVSSIKCLSYIHWANGLCYTKPSLF